MSLVVRVLWIAGLVALVALVVHERRVRIDPREHDRYASDVRSLRVLDARLTSEVLESRQALVGHYDGMSATQREIDGLLVRLDQIPSFVGGAALIELEGRIDASRAVAAEKEVAVEVFKSENAVFRNSVRYFPIAAEELRTALHGDGAWDDASELDEVLTSVLRFTRLPGSETERRRARKAIDDARSTPNLRDRDEQNEDVVLLHADNVLNRGARVDDLAHEIVQLPTPTRAAAVDAAYERAFLVALARADGRQRVLFGVALGVLFLFGVDVALRLRRSAAIERSAKERLAEANAALFREKEHERELRALKSRFVSMTSHEFRTPLSVILSSTELLEAYGDRWPANRKADHFGRIKGAIGRVTELLDRVLVIGKSESGRLPFHPKPIDLVAYARRLADTFEPTLDAKHQLEAKLEGAFQGAEADEKLLEHVLTNLLSNAVKYSPAGGTIWFELEEGADGDAVFVVEDEGIGIPQKDVARLFDDFHRGSNVGLIPGTGLGLAVVKRAVDSHGGSITVVSPEASEGADEDDDPRGTCFRVVIPVRPRAPASADEPAAAERAPSPPA